MSDLAAAASDLARPGGADPPGALRGRRGPVTESPDIAGLIAALSPRSRRGGPRPGDGVTCHVVQPPRPARHAAWPAGIDDAVRRAFARRGIELPWTHQAQAMVHVLKGRDVVVVSPTASGKSLCYAAPLVTRCLQDPDARALLVFPTKALALDQAQTLLELVRDARAEAGAGAPDIPVATFDGDTPADVRRSIRERGRIVVTNPDMLHAGILPHHARWAPFLQGLSHVVLDELHAYRGVFGSHVANVLRRLVRLAAFHGGRPSFVACSATIGNPREHASSLLGRAVELVDDDGAPRGERHVVLYNPPVIDAELGMRASAVGSARRLAVRSLEAGYQAIVFATSRLHVELLTRYVKDQLARRGRDPAQVEAYRGGLLPRQRRDVQARLRSGSLRGVVATSALELGIDVGSLDVSILCGYPGSVASTWQQMGRAGRRGRPAACVLVARGNPLDQHVVTHPEHLLAGGGELARTDPDNLLIVADHVKCAAFELPFRRGETFGRLGPEDTAELLGVLQEEGLVHEEAGTWHWTQETHPAEAVSLRSVSSDNFVVVDASTTPARVIAEVDFPSAPTTIHEKAIYMVGAKPYQVERLDYEGRKAYLRPVDCDYYTEAISYRSVTVLEVFETRASGPSCSALVRHGEVRVASKAVGFKKLKLWTAENLGYGDIALPEHEMHGISYWLTAGQPLVDRLADDGFSRREVVEGMTGVAHVLQAMACLLVLCDRRDLGWAIGDSRGAGERQAGWFLADGTPGGARPLEAGSGASVALDALERFEPTIFLYDAVPGGVGFAPALFDRHDELVQAGLDRIAACACDAGCPGCVGARASLELRGKHAARRVLETLVAESAGREARA